MDAAMRERVSRALSCSEEMPQAFMAGGLLVVRGALADLDRLLGVWKRASLSELPDLKGLTLSNATDGKLVLRAWLVSVDKGESVCVEFAVGGSDALPDFASVWPHASWWQNELMVFAGAKFSKSSEGGVKWQTP